MPIKVIGAGLGRTGTLSLKMALEELGFDKCYHTVFAIEAFNQYNDRVRRVVPPERLLVYEVREGWEPLCAFLGIPVPDGKPFPHVNDTAAFRARVHRGARIVRTGGYIIVVVVALVLAWLASRILF